MRTPLRPTAPPVSRPVGGSGGRGTSAQEQPTYQPSASLLTLAGGTVPIRGRDQRTAIRPLLDRPKKPVSSRAPVPNCGEGKRSERVAPGNRGEPGCSPGATRRKQAW